MADQDLEGSSLMSNPSGKQYGSAPLSDRLAGSMEAGKDLFYRAPVVDAMTYHSQELSAWSSVMSLSFTVWNRRTLWMTALKLLLLSLVVGVLVVAIVPDPGQLRVSKFTEISNFLRVFVGLLLGFFMSASVNRWWACVNHFLELCSSVRKIQMMLISCKVPEEEMQLCLRYGVLSAWILHVELHIQALPLDKQEKAKEEFWTKLRGGEDSDKTFGKMRDAEADQLQAMEDPAGTLWLWVGAVMGRLAEENRLHSPPMYARFMTLSGAGLDAIVKVRSNISVQAPYIYVHMLASLVHINNVVNALSFGMTGGVSVGTWLAWRGIIPHKARATGAEAAVDMQSLLVSFFFTCFGPFVYQALLEVSIAIAQPFSNNDAIVPTKRLLNILERELHEASASSIDVRAHPPTPRTPSR
mmetsp:Transcript_13915/g.24328  ORF Transcript_13915/g.24328 Transcript_13915/m.24328 type:complete len:413 (+) Transcript_13915:89-1327(+)